MIPDAYELKRIVRAHRERFWCSDDKRGRLIGRTKGGLNTKLHAVTDGEPSRRHRFKPDGERDARSASS